MLPKPLSSVTKLTAETVQYIVREKRFPARLTQNSAAQSLSFFKHRFAHRHKPLQRENVVIVDLPQLRHRYLYQILHLCSLTYSQVLFVWKFDLKSYVQLGHEGRRLFGIKNLKIVETVPDTIQPSTIVRSPSATHLLGQTQIIIDPDVAQPPMQDSVMMPYSVHPRLLEQYDRFTTNIQDLRQRDRPISILFSGNVEGRDRSLIEAYYGVPSRDRCVEYLLAHSSHLNVAAIDNFQQRTRLLLDPQTCIEANVVLCTCKGIPENWLQELAIANFFLALPGGYMLMCHNSIEAMAVGTIPILCYEDWFSPHLVHGQNCLTYRTLEELADRIKQVRQMQPQTIARMRSAVMEYYDRYLNPAKIAHLIQTYSGSQLRLHLNHEDAENLKRVNNQSILRCGGTLQSSL